MDEMRADIVVAGAGAAGLSAALALAQAGFATVLVGPEPAGGDGRTAALLDGALGFLGGLGIGPALAAASAPLRTLRIVDETASLFRPPPVEFAAGEIGLPAFGRNIENAALLAILAEAARRAPNLVWRTGLASGVEGAERDTLRLADGAALRGRVVVAADGRGSRLRAAAGIAARDRRLPQAALTAILRHERDHGGASTEFHRRGGPFTLVPLPGRRSSLVWVDRSEAVAARTALDDAALARAIEATSHRLLGRVALDGPRGSVPLGILSVDDLVAGRLVLVGEAGHALPPIGAQGLNLGLADVAALVEALAAARRDGRDIGAPETLGGYARARRGDVRLRTLAVEGLNAALLRDLAPLDAARGVALGLLARIGPLRRAAMRIGLGGASHARPQAGFRP